MSDSTSLNRILSRSFRVAFSGTVMERNTARQTINRLGLDNIREAYPPLSDLELFTYVHNDRADLVPSLTSTLSAMTEDGTIARLSAQDVNPQKIVQSLVCK